MADILCRSRRIRGRIQLGAVGTARHPAWERGRASPRARTRTQSAPRIQSALTRGHPRRLQNVSGVGWRFPAGLCLGVPRSSESPAGMRVQPCSYHAGAMVGSPDARPYASHCSSRSPRTAPARPIPPDRMSLHCMRCKSRPSDLKRSPAGTRSRFPRPMRPRWLKTSQPRMRCKPPWRSRQAQC